MATDKRINYEMQGHKKPARNYLGKQKTVKNIPVKWKSGPKTPETELAYITKAEKNLLLKKDLHGSLKHGPNTGPDGIMSLDSQGDYTADRSPAGRQSSPGGPDRSRQAQAQHEQALREVLTGQVDRGQTAAVSDRVRRGAVPEYVNTPSGMKYVGSAYKSTGQRGLLARLLGSRGYRGTVGTGSGRFFDRKSSIKTRGVPGQRGFEYFSEDEDVGDIKPGFGGRILGGLAGLATSIPFVGPTIGGAIDRFTPKPRDMSEFNRLGLGGTKQGTFDFNPNALINQKITDVPMESLTMENWGNTPNITDDTDQNFEYDSGNFRTSNLGGTYTPPNIPSPEELLNTPAFAAEGGRIGYQDGEFVEDINVEGPGFDENVMMASDDVNDRILESLYEEHYDRLKGLGHDDESIHEIIMGMFEDMSAQVPNNEQGLAGLV